MRILVLRQLGSGSTGLAHWCHVPEPKQLGLNK
jgi:hypothetical protein